MHVLRCIWFILQLPRGRDVEDEDCFVFNEEFSAPLYRIKVHLCLLMIGLCNWKMGWSLRYGRWMPFKWKRQSRRIQVPRKEFSRIGSIRFAIAETFSWKWILRSSQPIVTVSPEAFQNGVMKATDNICNIFHHFKNINKNENLKLLVLLQRNP